MKTLIINTHTIHVKSTPVVVNPHVVESIIVKENNEFINNNNSNNHINIDDLEFVDGGTF